MKIGVIKNAFEVKKLANIVEARREIEAFNTKIVPLLKILADGGVKVREVSPGWCTYVYLEEGQKMPTDVYGALGKATGEYPDLYVTGERSAFNYSFHNSPLWGLEVVLAKGTCKVKKIITVETKEVESVRYEQDGDCSGMSA